MKRWKRLLLGTYYHATLPLRAWRNARDCRAGHAPIIVLTYHRVADDRANSWTISFSDLVSQIDWLARRYEFVSLAEAQRRIRGRVNSTPCIAVTFDDGYAVNFERALPYLVSRRIPITYFVCADPVLRGERFRHDLEMGNRFLPNTVAELRTAIAMGIEIGAHTRTHADIGAISERRALFDEIVTAGEELQTALDQPIRYFAFPFGQHANMSAAAIRLAAEAGYDGVCSAYGGYNWPGDDAFHIQRICVDGPLIRAKNWVTVDPWKELRARRFFYGPPIARNEPTEVSVA